MSAVAVEEIARASTLPAAWYRDSAHWERERRAIFRHEERGRDKIKTVLQFRRHGRYLLLRTGFFPDGVLPLRTLRILTRTSRML